MYHTAECYFICTVILVGIFLHLPGSSEDCGFYNVHCAPLPKIYMWYTVTATFWVLNVEMFSCNSSPQKFQTFQNTFFLISM